MSAVGASPVAGLLAGPTTAARLAHLRDEGLADEVGLTWLLDRVEELVHDEPDSASNLAELCDQAAGCRALQAISARARYLRARVCAERGELDEALELISRAREAALAAGEHVLALRTELGRMQVLDDLGRHRDAVAVGEALLDALREDADDPTERETRGVMTAIALNNLGVAYSFLGNHDRSLTAYAESEAAYLALGLTGETAQPLANRGIELLALGRAREALGALQSAMDSFAQRGDRLWTAKCAGHLSQAYQHLGELTEALRVLEPARTTLAELGADAEWARVQHDIASVYLAAGLFSEAHAEAAVAVRRLSAANMPHDTALATFTMALADLAANRLDDAEAELRTAADLFDRVGDHQYQARVTLIKAEVAMARGRRVQAAALAAESTQALRAGGWLAPLAWSMLRQADLSDDDQTADLLLRAGELIEDLGQPRLRYAWQLRLARQRLREGRRDDAEALLREALELVERLCGSLPDSALRTAFRADKLGAHDSLVALLVARRTPADLVEACHIADRAKAQTLLDLIHGTLGARSRGSHSDDSQGRLDRCRADLSATYVALLAAEESGMRTLLRRQAADLERQANGLRLRLAVTGPEKGVEDRDAVALPRDLPSTPALAYHVVDDDIIAFVTEAGRVRVRNITGVAPAVGVELDRLAAQWNRFRFGSAFVQRNQEMLLSTTRQILGELYRLLVAPIQDLLADLTSAELAVVPHRFLHQLPFHALFDGTRYLAQRWAITVRPSLAGVDGHRFQRGRDGVLVLAVPDAQAPAIAAEARAIAATVPGARVLLGDAATSQVLAEQMPGPGVLHIACHGLYQAANPLFSALRLADRWMSAAEILGLDLGGAFVTLSACESGRPARHTAEPVGLAWAFLAAGASGVVTSQWIVNDDATTALMSRLYAHLAAGERPAEALRLAQLATAEKHPHPYYWAPFTYVASPATSPKRSRP